MQQSLKEILSQESITKIAIWLQDHPDPDAMGSAMGFSYLAKKYNKTCDIFYAGSLSHPQNKTMANLLSLPMKTADQYQAEIYQLVVFLDVANANKGNLTANVVSHIVIDHHRDMPQNELLFKDIRNVGACSSIIASYLKDEIPKEEMDEEFSLVATGLLVGIKTDTNELTSPNVATLDREAYEFLLRYADASKLHQIVNFTIPRYLYSIKADAYKSIVQQHSLAVVGLGILTPQQRDAMPIVADDLLRMEGIETVVVFAIIKDCLVSSIRSANDGIDVNAFCHQIFGSKFSGGKQGAGGASVPLGLLAISDLTQETKEQVWETYKAVIQQKVFCLGS